MGVYIKGMEMPTLYRTYKVRFAESGDGKIIAGIANEDSTAYRMIGEVIPVPPRGRLIDAEALLKKKNTHIDVLADWRYVRVSTIEDAPTIIEREGE